VYLAGPRKTRDTLEIQYLVQQDTEKRDTERLGDFSISKIFEIPYLVPHLNEIHLFGCISTQIQYLGTSGVCHHHQTDHTTQHNTLLSQWPISAIKRVPLYSPDGQYWPSEESTVCGWPISAVNGLCFLLMANIAHQQRDTPSQRLLSAIGRVYHPPDG
jgi:hypothetical protein